MQCLVHVSKHAIQAIIDEFNDILSLSRFHTAEILREVFAKHNIEVAEEVTREISHSVRKEIQYLLPHQKKVHYQ